MRNRSNAPTPRRPCRFLVRLAVFGVILGFAWGAWGQTPPSGALTGVTMDPSGAVLSRVTIHLAKLDGTADDNGRFGFLFLSPGDYEIQASKSDFRRLSLPDLHVSVTETLLELRVELATQKVEMQISSQSSMVQLGGSALGRTVNEETVTGLALVTRNFTQIASRSPGVTVGVYNAGELGSGGTALSQMELLSEVNQ
jgi:hypothetical protein